MPDNLQSLKELRSLKICSHDSCEISNEGRVITLTALPLLIFVVKYFHLILLFPLTDNEILEHLNAEGKKIYSHLHKFKTHQTSANKNSKERSKVGYFFVFFSSEKENIL